MSRRSQITQWNLDNRRAILIVLTGVTDFLGYYMTQISTDHTTGHFLSKESQTVQNFERASEVFGQSQTILYLVFEEANPYDQAFLQALDSLAQEIATYEGVDNVVSLTNVPFLLRQDKAIVAQPLYRTDLPFEDVRQRLEGQPFLRGLLLSNDGATAMMMVKINVAFNDRPERVELVERIEAAAGRLPGTLALAGFPYLRSQYARRIGR